MLRQAAGRSSRVNRLALAAACLLCASAAQGHDFWIEPSTFHPAPSQTVAVGLRVGQDFIGDAVPHFSNAIASFSIRQAGHTETIEGADGINPAGFLRADGAATAVISYASNGADIELPAGPFEDYLRLYGVDAIIEQRSRRRERAKPGRERFYRYAKALLSGREPSEDVTEPLGLAYEIIADEDPTRRLAPFRGHVLYDGKPLAGALVVALLQGQPSVHLAARSDVQGGFSFALPRTGIWLIKSVHMVRASFFSSEDWDSLWASLTFEIREPHP
jgi:uncharacterized GH25 family protein